jgi:hypothetical protein
LVILVVIVVVAVEPVVLEKLKIQMEVIQPLQ